MNRLSTRNIHSNSWRGIGIGIPIPIGIVAMCAFSLAACQQDRGAQPSRRGAESASPTQAAAVANGTSSRKISMSKNIDAAQAAKPSFDTVLRVVGGECNDLANQSGCTVGDYDLVLHPGCGAEGLFGGVSDDAGAILIDAAPPDDTTKRATLAKGQFVCVQATANAGASPAWYYVSAVPVASVAACAGNKLCDMYGDREVVWHDDKPMHDCATLGMPQFKGRCVSGWMRSEELDLFSNGL